MSFYFHGYVSDVHSPNYFFNMVFPPINTKIFFEAEIYIYIWERKICTKLEVNSKESEMNKDVYFHSSIGGEQAYDGGTSEGEESLLWSEYNADQVPCHIKGYSPPSLNQNPATVACKGQQHQHCDPCHHGGSESHDGRHANKGCRRRCQIESFNFPITQHAHRTGRGQGDQQRYDYGANPGHTLQLSARENREANNNGK